MAYSQAFTKSWLLLNHTSPTTTHSLSPSITTLTSMVVKIVGLLRVKQFEKHRLKIMLALTSMLRDSVRHLNLQSEWLKRQCGTRTKCRRLNKVNRKSTRHLDRILEQLYHISSSWLTKYGHQSLFNIFFKCMYLHKICNMNYLEHVFHTVSYLF